MLKVFLWTEAEENLVLALLDQPVDFVAAQVAKQFGKPGFENSRTKEAVARKMKRLAPDNYRDPEEEYKSIKQRALEEVAAKYATEQESAYLTTNGKDRFILSISDLHAPFFPVERVVNILETHKKELSKSNSIIVINGDLMDQYSASVFPKYKKVALVDEYTMALDIIDMCLDYCQNVVLTSGNHDSRISKLLNDHLNEEVRTLMAPNILARLANGEELDKFGMVKKIRTHFKGRVKFQWKEPWYVRIGKTIFAHPSGYKSGVAGTVIAVADQMKIRYGREDFDAVVIGHTHKCTKAVLENRLLIEQGSICGSLDYELKSNLTFGNSHNGYAIIYQDKDGNTNFNDSTFVYLGSKLPKKKKVTL